MLKKKRIAFPQIGLVLLCLCLMIPAVAWGSLSTSSHAAGLSADVNKPPGYPQNGIYGQFFRVMIALILVIGLVIAVLYGARRVVPKLTHVQGRRIQVIETTLLGPRKALHLIKVQNKNLLIASTHDRITMLTSLDPDIKTKNEDQVSEVLDT